MSRKDSSVPARGRVTEVGMMDRFAVFRAAMV